MKSNILKHYDYLILGAILLIYIFQVKRKAFEIAKRKQVIIALKLCFYSSVILYVLQILSIFLNNTFSIDSLTITFWTNLLVAGTVAMIDLTLFRGNFIKQKRKRSQITNTRSKSPDWEFVELLSDDQKKSIIQYDFSKHQDSAIAKKIYYEYHTQIFYNFKFCKMDAHDIAIYQNQRTLLTKSWVVLGVALIALFFAIYFVQISMEAFFVLVGVSLFFTAIGGIFIFKASQKPLEYFVYIVSGLYNESLK